MHAISTNDIVLGLIGIIVSYMAWLLQKLINSSEAINEKVAVIANRVETKEKAVDNHEERLRAVERGVAVLERKGSVR